MTDTPLVTIETTDLTLAATLKALGYQLVGIQLSTHQYGIFTFDEVEDYFEDDYNVDRVQCSPRQFMNELRFLKTAVTKLSVQHSKEQK